MKICAKNVLVRGEKTITTLDGVAPHGTDRRRVPTVKVNVVLRMYIVNPEFICKKIRIP